MIVTVFLKIYYVCFQLLGRTLRVDHVKDYKPPKETGDEDEITQKVRAEGVAPKAPSTEGEQSEEEQEVAPKKAKKGEAVCSITVGPIFPSSSHQCIAHSIEWSYFS